MRSFYSATNHSRTVCLFCLGREGVSYNGKGYSVFVSFHKNRTIALYWHILYVHSMAISAGVKESSSPNCSCQKMYLY